MEQRRDKLCLLEADVIELKKKEKEVLKLIKSKEENEKHCEKLRQEIVHIKIVQLCKKNINHHKILYKTISETKSTDL